MTRLARLRPLLLPVGLVVLALTVFNLRISREMADFEVSRAAGRRALAAQPLYQETGGHDTFTSLPAFAVAMAPAALAGSDVARAAWFGLSCACLVILLRWSVIALPARRWSERSLILLAVVLLARFYAHELTLGQPNLLLAVLLMAGLGALQLGAPRLAGVCVGLAVFVTPYALLLLPWIAISAGLPAGLAGLAAVLAGLTTPIALYGWSGNLEQLAGWWRLGSAPVSLAAMWATWIGAGWIATVFAVVTAALLLAVAAATWLQRRRVQEPDYLEFAMLLLLVPLLFPQGSDYALLLGTPAVVLILDRWRELRAPWRWASAAALMLMGLPYMAWSIVPVCAIALVATLAQIRVKGLA